jgi:hypothetical protein
MNADSRRTDSNNNNNNNNNIESHVPRTCEDDGAVAAHSSITLTLTHTTTTDMATIDDTSVRNAMPNGGTVTKDSSEMHFTQLVPSKTKPSMHVWIGGTNKTIHFLVLFFNEVMRKKPIPYQVDDTEFSATSERSDTPAGAQR